MMKLSAITVESPASPSSSRGSPEGRKRTLVESATEKLCSPFASMISASQQKAAASGNRAARSSISPT